MLTYFLFLFYLVAGIIMLQWMVRRKGFAFSIYHTTAAVLFKVFMGCLYGYIFLHYYGGDDTWDFFTESLGATDVLLKNPARFMQELLPSFSLHITHHHGWNALVFYIAHFERWFMIKSLAVLNLLSGKNYYIDLLWFDLLTITGSFILYKMLVSRFPARAGVYYLLVFFIPSVTFWCSGIRAEALILLFISIILYNGKAYSQRPGWRNAAGILLGLIGFLLFRLQFLAIFLPAFIAYMLSIRNKKSSPVYFNRVYFFGLLIFIMSLFLPASYSLSGPFIRSQRAFFQLHGNTRYTLDSLQPGPVSFLKILPQAIVNSCIRPFPWEGKSPLQSIASIENIFLLAGIVFFVSSYRKKQPIQDPLLWLFFYYGITQLIAIGYAVPFPGAIVRYRCIPGLFIFLFLFSENDLLQEKVTKIFFP